MVVWIPVFEFLKHYFNDVGSSEHRRRWHNIIVTCLELHSCASNNTPLSSEDWVASPSLCHSVRIVTELSRKIYVKGILLVTIYERESVFKVFTLGVRFCMQVIAAIGDTEWPAIAIGETGWRGRSRHCHWQYTPDRGLPPLSLTRQAQATTQLQARVQAFRVSPLEVARHLFWAYHHL